MIWRIRERSVLSRIAHEGRRTRAGVLWCNVLPDSSATPPRVAFAINRAVGSSTVRNLVRRRLRVILAAADLEPGWYLVGVRPAAAARSFAELSSDVEVLCAQLARWRSPSPPPASNFSSSPIQATPSGDPGSSDS